MIRLKIFLYSFLVILLFSNINVNAQIRIGNIYLDRRNVFDTTTKKDWFFAAGLFNSLHVITKPYIIEDEMLFDEDEELDLDNIYETERNLRNTGLFTDVKIIVDSVDEKLSNITIITQDKWSTEGSILFGTGGEKQTYGVRAEEKNLIGTATDLKIEGLYRTENNIQWQGTATLSQPRLFRSEIGLNATIIAHKYKTIDSLTISKIFRTMDTKYAYGITLNNIYGSDFAYTNTDSTRLLPIYEKTYSGWIAQSWRKKDRVFACAYFEYNDVQRILSGYRRAYDNSGKVLLSFSSVSEFYYKTNKLNTFHVEDLPTGGYGTATLGRVFPIGSKGDNMFYVGGQGELSRMYGNLYVFGQLTGGSCFAYSMPDYTYQEFFGLSFYRFNDNLLFAARVREQTVWRWIAYRQLILDTDAGLRGYSANEFVGDNRFVANFELRVFPEINCWIFKLGATAFYDVGSVWRQDTTIFQSQFHHSIGLGLRIFNMKATGGNGTFRIDFAYNLDKKKLGEIIFTTDQLFSVFGKHEFKLPTLYGRDFDSE